MEQIPIYSIIYSNSFIYIYILYTHYCQIHQTLYHTISNYIQLYPTISNYIPIINPHNIPAFRFSRDPSSTHQRQPMLLGEVLYDVDYSTRTCHLGDPNDSRKAISRFSGFSGRYTELVFFCITYYHLQWSLQVGFSFFLSL